MQAGRVLDDAYFIDQARKHFNWVKNQQQPNGWINYWHLNGDMAVLHTIAYTLRGMCEAGIFYQDNSYIEVVRKGIDFLYQLDRQDFKYPEVIPSYCNYQGEYLNELCITGLSQLAIILKKMSFFTQADSVIYKKRFETIVSLTKYFQFRGFKNENMNGAMPGSWPIFGKYQCNDLIQWGTKFFMDTMLLSMGVNPSQIKG